MLRCLTLVTACALPGVAFAQAPCCTPAPAAQPTVAYSPVVATPAPAPTVLQTTVVNDPWYPGKYLADFTRNLFGANPTTTTTAYAPTPYTAGYAPTSYVTQRAVYRPTYPATYGPVVQTVARPVALAPVVSLSPAVATTACDPCSSCVASPVEQAYYGEPAGGCSSCSGGAATVTPAQAFGGGASGGINSPELPVDEDFPATRNKPPVDDDMFNGELEPEPADDIDQASADDWFTPPPLFAPPSNNNVARRTHAAPVRQAVYRAPVDGRGRALRPASHAAAKPRVVQRLSADGWASAE